ncbi:hypothetical protein T439DRAFT_51764 [Meredithblackwellia eburnea MCA 4105]
MSKSEGTNLFPLIGLAPSSARLSTALNLSNLPDLEIKAFSDSVYYSYHSIGLSLVFHPHSGYKPKFGTPRDQIDEAKLALASIDIYNHEANLEPPSSSSSASKRRPPSSVKPTFAAFPLYPLAVAYPSTSSQTTLQILLITTSTIGRDFVTALGEPDRKGGGEGSIGIWTEWTSHGIMVEFASGGLQAWDKGGEATWKTVTLFEKGVSAGKDEGEAGE